MPAYVTLPGTSGNYFDTPDVNLLDADTAHLHQSKGSWAIQEAEFEAPVQSADWSLFGDFSLKAVIDIASSSKSLALAFLGVNGFAAVQNDVVSIGAWVYHETGVTHEFNVQYREFNGGSALSNAASANVEVPSGVPTLVAHTHTMAQATADNLRWGIRVDATAQAVDVGDAFYFDQAFARKDSTKAFVPSLRIVGDLDIEAKVALDDYTPTATNTILDCLNSNDGYRLRHTTGDLIEIAYGNGSSTRAQTSSATGLTDGTAHVIKVTVDQSTGAVVYYIDGVQHDTDTMTTGAGASDINDLVVGANAAASANWTDGDIYYVIVRDGIDGPVIARFDADDWVGV